MTPEYMQAAALIGLGIIFVLLAIWLVVRANRKTTIVGDEASAKDVLDEGAAPAERNQALIDAPRSVDAPLALKTPEPVPVAPPAPAPTPPPAPTATAEADDLRKIKGVGPKLVAMLAEQGITSFAQIAAWNDADIERVDATLGRFAGRITRDQWVEQAKLLESGEESAFSSKFGQNG